MTMPIGPRRINELRRVTIPTRAGRGVGVEPGCWVVVTALRRDHAVLVIRPAPDTEPAEFARLDPRRPRRVSDTGQLALPAPLLDAAGLAVGQWVAFSPTRGGLRLFAAERVRGPELGAA
jgi:bifunctional DNA-binding transcriptional regulator/antitoxin component of YhaV-PrlF toxin-antitoxin module